MASKLARLQAKADQASQFVAKLGRGYHKQYIFEQNKHYIQEPPIFEKYNLMSRQLFHFRLAISRPSPIGSSKTFSKSFQRHKMSFAEKIAIQLRRFSEWIAGVIDGAGNFEFDKEHEIELTITKGYGDVPLIRYIQHEIGGTVETWCGKTFFRAKSRKSVAKLVHCINGHIRDSERLRQLHIACRKLDIPLILPGPLYDKSNWFAGFFDCCGTIEIELKPCVQVCIRVKSQHLENIEPYKIVFGMGYLCSDNGYYQWSVQSRTDILKIKDYFYYWSTFRSLNSRRFFLIEYFVSLYDLDAFDPDSVHHPLTLAFLDEWNKVTII